MLKCFSHFHLECGQLESQQEESEREALKQSAKPHDSLSKCMDECILFYNKSAAENKGGNKKRNSQGLFSMGQVHEQNVPKLECSKRNVLRECEKVFFRVFSRANFPEV